MFIETGVAIALWIQSPWIGWALWETDAGEILSSKKKKKKKKKNTQRDGQVPVEIITFSTVLL